MKAIPKVVEGVTVTAMASPEQPLRYRVAASGSPGTILPARTFVALLLMDGAKTIGDLHEALIGLGFKLPDPSRTLGLVRTFEAAGVIEVDHHFVTAEPLRHACSGCGRSCEGHLVGPLDDAEAHALQEQLDTLRAEDPAAFGPGRDAATRIVSFEGEDKRVLHFPEGRCVFLDSDRRCRLHSRWGPHAKPLPCRMFPFRMVRTEDGTRVAISPRCFRAHETRDVAPIAPEELLAEWGVWRVPAVVQGLDPEQPDRLGSSPAAESARGVEDRLLALCDDPATTLGSVVAVLGAHPASPRVSDRFADAALTRVQEVLRGFDVGGAESAGGFAGALRALVREGVALGEGGLRGGDDLDGDALAEVRHRLRHLVFARETMLAGSLRAGVLAFVCGVLLARSLAGDPAKLAVFRERLTTWARIMESAEVLDVLLPSDEEVDALLAGSLGGNDDGRDHRGR